MEGQVEPEYGRGGSLVYAEVGCVKGVHGEDIAVPAVTLRRRRPHVGVGPRVIAQHERPGRQALTPGGTGPARKLRHLIAEADDGPVPKAAGSGRVRVEARNGETLGLGREA